MFVICNFLIVVVVAVRQIYYNIYIACTAMCAPVTGYTITPRMRTILVDWLVQVHLRFHLLQETLYLTIAIIDRFLQVTAILGL